MHQHGVGDHQSLELKLGIELAVEAQDGALVIAYIEQLVCALLQFDLNQIHAALECAYHQLLNLSVLFSDFVE